MDKKLLVSDYDGTLKSNVKNLKLNKEAINKFREHGNLFAISTGRSYNSIKNECNKYDIKYDYLFCNNGRVLFDSNDQILFEKAIDFEIVQNFVSVINWYYGIKNIGYYDSYGKSDFTNYDRIIDIIVDLKLFNEFNKFKKLFEQSHITVDIVNYFLYSVISSNFDKGRGLEILAKKIENEVSRENIITVGDNYNDLSMLKKFNGYKVLFSYPFLYGRGIKTVREVHTLIKKIDK